MYCPDDGTFMRIVILLCLEDKRGRVVEICQCPKCKRVEVNVTADVKET